MISCRVVSNSLSRQLRYISRCTVVSHPETQHQVETPAPNVTITPLESLIVPGPGNADKPASPKIEKLVTEISQLNLIEVSELSGLLKKRLNLPDAPAFPMGGFAAAAPVSAEDEEDAVPQKVKSVFTVKLMKFDEKQKVALIKEMKSLMEGMNLVQAKKFVEGAPAVVKVDVSKEEAEKLKEAIEKVGGVVEVD